MQVIELANKDKETYNIFVAENGGSFLQSFEWGQWLESSRGVSEKRIWRYAVLESKTWLVSAQVVTTPLPLKSYYVYIPYGPVFKENATARDTEEGLALLLAAIKKEHPKALFIRIEPTHFAANLLPGKKSVNIQPGNTIVNDLTEPEEILLAGMHNKTRYSIQVAERHNVEVKDITHNQTEVVKAAHMMVQTLQRRHLVTQKNTHHQRLITFFNAPQYQSSVATHIFGAYLREALLAAALMVDFAGTRTYLFGGSSTEYKNAMAPYLLHWHMMKDAKAKGLTTYDWYGGESSTGEVPGFVRFKLRFGGKVIQYQGVRDIILHHFAYQLYLIFRQVNRWIKHR